MERGVERRGGGQIFEGGDSFKYFRLRGQLFEGGNNSRDGYSRKYGICIKLKKDEPREPKETKKAYK